MNEPRRPFAATSPSKRKSLKLDRIITADDTLLGKPMPVPASRRALVEVKNNAENQKDGEIMGKREKRRWKPRTEFEVFEDLEAKTEGPPPQARPHKSIELQPTPQVRLPPPRLPPSSLTALLLSHSSPRPILPPLPSPPRSRQPRESPLDAAHEASPHVPPPTATPYEAPSIVPDARRSTHHNVPPAIRPPPPATSRTRHTRTASHSVPLYNAPPRRSTRQQTHGSSNPSAAASHSFSDRSIDLTNLPPLTHHSEHAIISLHPPTHLTLHLRGNAYTHSITRTHVTSTHTPTRTSQTYALDELPWKHLPAYRYARRFAASVRRRTLVAHGGVDGVYGRLWADGRGVVAFSRPIAAEVEIVAGDGEGRAVVRSEGEDKELRVPLNSDVPVVAGAREVYAWLLKHPRPVYAEDDGDGTEEWRLTSETNFVKGVGWCREVGEGKWSMKFLDGVRLEVSGGEVIWIDSDTGRRRVGLKDSAVRKRVAEFVKAGL